MVSMMDILSGASPLIVDVRQTGASPLGELLQERMHFSCDLQRGLRPLELLGEAFVLAAQPVELDLLSRAALLRLPGQSLRAPASTCLRHSEMWELYRPSRRRIAPRSSEPFGQVSYLARISALYSALKVRRVGRAEGSMSSVTPPVWARPFNDAVVMVMVFVFLLLAPSVQMIGYRRCVTSP
jgi:hypothetical protein